MKLIFRIIFDIVVFISVFILPWWLSLIVILVGIFVWPYFFESFILAIFLDGFHGISGISFHGHNAFFVLLVSVFFIVSMFLKTRLKFY